MARKYDFISELYNRTCKTVVANPASWEAFLRSACYNYRLRFDEQLLVHAQRPDATAVLQIDDWNQKFGRWVNRGAHGIAVFEDADQRRQRLVHYFDISDTHPSRFSRRVPIWQMRDEYTAEVIDTLESTFGELNDKETLAVAIESAARNAVEDNIPDYLSDLIYSVKDSFLDGVSEEEITHIFKTAVRNSVAYMTMTRLGIEAGEYFEPDDLRDVVNFTTPATLNALGYATSDIAEMGLAEISRTILALDRQNRIIAEKTKADYNVGKEKTERSPDDERDHLHEAGGLSAPRSDNAGATGAVDGQVRPDAEEVPEGASQGTLLQPADELRPERASERHGAQSERDGTDADGADGSVGGRDGEPESDGYDELGSEDEQYPEPGSGDRDGGGNLRLDYYDRSHEDKSLPFFGGDDTIREILGTTPHLKASKDEIRAFFEATADENARISYIKRIFNNDYTEVILSDGRRVGYKTYQNVLQLWEGSYLSRTAQSFYDWGVIAQHFEAMRLLGELQDTMKPLPSIDGQLSLMTAGAEERKPSAFTFSQEIIDAVLTRGSGISEGKMRIYEQFQKSLSAKENADFLKNEYGWGGVYPAITGAGIDEQHDGKGIRISKGIGSDKPHIDLKWSQVEKRIAELIKLDRYLNPKEKAQYPAWLQRQEERHAELAEERRNREILSTAPSEKTEPKNERYEYHLGSTVYLGANEYEILSFDDERVMLYTQLFQQLYYQADSVHGGRLPVHVHFVMDEFANVALPDEFDKLLSTMRSREISVSIIIQNLAQLKALFEKQWESIVGNCDEFLYLGGNEQSTHEYVSKLLGKETIDTNTYGRSRGRNGSYSTNYQLAGRELMTPDEVRMLDNRYALLFIRGERPIRDLKYDILHHPNVALTTDGSAPAYTHGEDTRSIASMAFSFDKKAVKNAEKLEAEKHEFLLYSEEELEELLDEKEKKDNEEA